MRAGLIVAQALEAAELTAANVLYELLRLQRPPRLPPPPRPRWSWRLSDFSHFDCGCY